MQKRCFIYIFRHGQTVFNQEGKFTGRHESSLTKKGVRDAKMVALRLKDKNFTVAFHTSLKRSQVTLNEVLKCHPECDWIVQDDRMIERSYGTLEGKTHLDLMQKFGVKKYDAWHRGFTAVPAKGESFAMVEKRVNSFISDLKKFIAINKCSVAISAHGNSIRLFRKVWEGLSREETTHLTIPYDDVRVYEVKVKE